MVPASSRESVLFSSNWALTVAAAVPRLGWLGTPRGLGLLPTQVGLVPAIPSGDMNQDRT